VSRAPQESPTTFEAKERRLSGTLKIEEKPGGEARGPRRSQQGEEGNSEHSMRLRKKKVHGSSADEG